VLASFSPYRSVKNALTDSSVTVCTPVTTQRVSCRLNALSILAGILISVFTMGDNVMHLFYQIVG